MSNIVTNKNGIEFDIDAIATDLNGKMDRDGVNAECPTLLSRTPNNQGGVVEIWSDGYYVETGRTSNYTNTASGTAQGKTVVLSESIVTLIMFEAKLAVDTTLGNGSVSGYSNRVLVPYQSLSGGNTLSIDEWNNGVASGTSCIAIWRAEGYIR